MVNSVNSVITVLVNLSIVADVIGNCPASADRAQDKVDVMRLIPPIIRKLQWRNIEVVTDFQDLSFISKELTRADIYHSVNRPSLINFNKQQSNKRIVVWCATSCLQDIHLEAKFFGHCYFWLLVYRQMDHFNKDLATLSDVIRVDSQIYALIPDCNHKWLLVKLQYTKQIKNNIVQKTLAYINKEMYWIDEIQGFWQNLQGVNVSSMMFHWPPLSYVKRTKCGISITSVYYDLMLIMANYLGFSFHYKIILAEDDGVNLSNTNLWDFQRQMLREKKINMSGMIMPVIRDHLNGMSHSSFVFSSRSTVILSNIRYHQSHSHYNLASYSKAFTHDVWICIFLIAVVCITLSFISSARSVTHNLQINNFQYWYNWINLFIKNALISYAYKGQLPASKKIFIFVLLLFTALVTANYGSILTAILTAETYKMPFETLGDLIDDGKFMIGTLRNSSMHSTIINTKTGVLFKIQNKSLYQTYLTPDEGYDKIIRENFAALLPIEFSTRLNCSYTFLKTTYLPVDISFNLQEDSPYVEIFSKFIMRLRSAGILQRILGRLTHISRFRCDLAHNKFESVNLAQSIFPFFLLAIGIIIVLLIFIAEVIISIVRN